MTTPRGPPAPSVPVGGAEGGAPEGVGDDAAETGPFAPGTPGARAVRGAAAMKKRLDRGPLPSPEDLALYSRFLEEWLDNGGKSWGGDPGGLDPPTFYLYLVLKPFFAHDDPAEEHNAADA